jgi:hypothetical protein
LLALLDHVSQDLQHASGTAAEGVLCQDQIPLVHATLGGKHFLVDCPEAVQRECGDIKARYLAA